MNSDPAIMEVLLGVAMGMSFMFGLSRKITAGKIRSRFLKLAETHSFAITDFAGKDVSLERFCDKLLGPGAYYQQDEQARKQQKRNWLLAILLLFLVTVAILAVFYFS